MKPPTPAGAVELRAMITQYVDDENQNAVQGAVKAARERFHHWHHQGSIRQFAGSFPHDTCRSPGDCECACGTCRSTVGGAWRECWIPKHLFTVYDERDYSNHYASALRSIAEAVVLLEAEGDGERTRTAIATLRMALATLLDVQPPSAMEQRRRAKEDTE